MSRKKTFLRYLLRPVLISFFFAEPNLLNHTAHSVTKKGIKKRDLSDVELREILSDLLQHVC